MSTFLKNWPVKGVAGSRSSEYTVNVDCVKFEYVVLAKYHHMLIFEFDLLTKPVVQSIVA
jgi:hypothetical protein